MTLTEEEQKHLLDQIGAPGAARLWRAEDGAEIALSISERGENLITPEFICENCGFVHQTFKKAAGLLKDK